MREDHTTRSWRRWLGQRVALAAIGSTVIMSTRSGLAPHWKHWAASFALLAAPTRDASGLAKDTNPWVMGLTLWLLSIITAGILWVIARHVLRNADHANPDPDQHEDPTDGRNNGHDRTWDF